MKVLLSILLIVSTIFTLGCDEEESTTSSIAVGADQLEEYLPYLEGKRVGLVVNPTSRLNTGVHLIDAMIEEQVNVTTLFAPEHGLRGEQDAGEEVEDGIDPETGLPVISLYGDHKKLPRKICRMLMYWSSICRMSASAFTRTSVLCTWLWKRRQNMVVR
ncbi:hypothetical protein N779_14395 [Vibrio coralliilyticus OCN008]|nr:hypothetical protein N779_14395 [Vibrio coralliilyticus OCN008]